MKKIAQNADANSIPSSQWDSQNPPQLARRRRVNVLLAVALAVVALGFFFSAWLIDFESMSQ